MENATSENKTNEAEKKEYYLPPNSERFKAFLIDFLFFFTLALLIGILTRSLEYVWYLSVGTALLFEMCFLYWKGATLGKSNFQFQVLSYPSHQKLRLWQCVARTLAKYLSFYLFFIPFVFHYLNRKRRNLVDMLTGTAVVSTSYNQEREETNPVLFAFLFLIPSFLFYNIFYNSTPRHAQEIHDRIKIGMSMHEVYAIVNEGNPHHSYIIRTWKSKKDQQCLKDKPAFDQCLVKNTTPANWRECLQKYPVFEFRGGCEGQRIIKKEEFLPAMTEAMAKKKDYALIEGEIAVTYMGPMFMHNTFHVFLDRGGKVKFVTDKETWD
jgi:uncharacterized RDD family membrane protein YckC